MKKYKLTTQAMQTHNDFQWKLCEERVAEGKGTEPCSPDVLHYYHHPVLAILLNPIHAAFSNPRLFEVKCSEELGTDGLKGWCKKQTLTMEIPVPKVSTTQKVAFAINVALLVYKAPSFVAWAEKWLQGTDRSAAYAARAAAFAAAAYDASAARAYDAAAAHAAARAADAATYAAAAYDAAAARAADAAARAATYAAAARAAARAADAAFSGQLISIAKEVMSNF